jgi:hypothetical protein
MKMRFGLGVLAYLVPTFALGFVWHLMLFKVLRITTNGLPYTARTSLFHLVFFPC